MTVLLVKLLGFFIRLFGINKLKYPSVILYGLLRFYRNGIIEENLKRSFPNKGIAEIKTLNKAYHHHLSNVIAETLQGFSMSQVNLAKQFKFKNADLANEYFDNGQSIILVLGHIGNWEWGQAIVSHYLKHNCVGVYKPLSNKSFNEYILSKRSQYRVKLLPQKQLLKYLLSHKDEINVYIFIADQYPPVEPRVKVNFLNQETYFDSSVEKIAIKYRLPVLYADIAKVSPNGYETELIEIYKGIDEFKTPTITERFAGMLEGNILRNPSIWLWSHRRWK